jgi:hypothetical protein
MALVAFGGICWYPAGFQYLYNVEIIELVGHGKSDNGEIGKRSLGFYR